MEWVRRNALIESTMFGWEDHGILTFSLGLDYGGTHQAAGCLSLSGGKPTSYAYRGLELLADILRVVGVDEWEKLKGQPVVALFDNDGWNEPVRGLDNFLSTRQVIWADYLTGW